MEERNERLSSECTLQESEEMTEGGEIAFI